MNSLNCQHLKLVCLTCIKTNGNFTRETDQYVAYDMFSLYSYLIVNFSFFPITVFFSKITINTISNFLTTIFGVFIFHSEIHFLGENFKSVDVESL